MFYTYLNPFFGYQPSFPAAIAFALVFFTLTSVHAAFLKFTKRLFSLPFIVGGTAEFVGFICRIVVSRDLWNIESFTGQSVLLLCSPIILNVATHMFLYHVIVATEFTRYSLLKPIAIPYVLGFVDLAALTFQIWGTVQSISPNSAHQANWARNLIRGGLGLQLIVPLLSFVFAGTFYFRLRKHNVLLLTKPRLRLSLCMASVFIAGLLMQMRTMYRFASFVQEPVASINLVEWPLYAFDAGCMVLLMGIGLLWYHVDTEEVEVLRTERALDVPLEHLNSITYEDALVLKAALEDKIGRRTSSAVAV